MKATITSLIFLLLSLTVSSQTYKYIGIEEGLSNQKIYKIQKDARGYMWFLTHVGIDQYNGKEIKHYKLREGNRELDPLLNINWTFLDKTGTLLVTGKQGRIFRYDSGHDRFVQIYNMYNYWNKDYHAFVRYSYIDQEDNVWLCGKSAIHLFNIESGQKQQISNRLGNITCIEQINSEHFFIGTDKRIYLAKLENGNLKELSCNYGADGIVGPHHEKEGSYFTIKQVWCPIQIMTDSLDSQFDGKLKIENRYDFLNANTCRFTYKYVQLPSVTDKGGMKVMKQGEVNCPDIPAHGAGTLTIPAAVKGAHALMLTVTDKQGNDLFTWSYKLDDVAGLQQASAGNKPSYKETADALTVDAGGRTFTFSQKDGQLKGVKVGSRIISLANGPRFIAAKRSDRSMDQFYNHDDKEAEKKKTQYTTFDDAGRFTGFTVREEGNNVVVTANYKLGCFDQAVWTIAPDGTAAIDFTYNFSGVVDLMGVMFDYPEDKVLSKRWVGDGPYRVWQNRLHGPQLGVWENEYNDPIPAESFTYPEFKGYFANVQWMTLKTQEGTISICNRTPQNYVGVYQPRDGRDGLLYTFPATGISLMKVIPPVRNKVNTTDLIGPSSQAFWADGAYGGSITLKFE